MDPTYKIVEGPPPVAFAEYSAATLAAWGALLSNSPAESAVQDFLERTPALLPIAEGPGGATTAWPFTNILVSQPRLPGLNAHQPDFLWFTNTSSTWYTFLVEIEQPSRRLFRRDGVPTAHFTVARNQLAQWRTWFHNPVNQLKFREEYGIPDMWPSRRTMELRLVLIYGRRSEFEQEPNLSKQRSSLLPGSEEELMSFDRLQLNPFARDAVTVRALGNGRYRALRVPATFTLGPLHADRLLYVDGLADAIDNSHGWSEDRRLFVQQRIPYWTRWARLENKGWVSGGEE
jgi:hypothetical protein